MTKSISTFLFAAFALPSIGLAMPMLMLDAGGQLQGAKNVDVNGIFYDVVFTQGSCSSVFNGCNAPADLQFASRAEADSFSEALFASVIVAEFATMPELIAGCAFTTGCSVASPYELELFPPCCIDVIASAVRVFDPGAAISGVGLIGVDNEFSGAGLVYAQWTVSPPTPVDAPVPAMLLLLGLLGLSAKRSRARS